jgi:hypothetical protein
MNNRQKENDEMTRDTLLNTSTWSFEDVRCIAATLVITETGRR